jgi:putative ABC transport system permease protein
MNRIHDYHAEDELQYTPKSAYPALVALHLLQHALRRLGREPLFAAGVIAMLAVAIGANTAIFTLVHAVLMRPLPLRDPAGLITFTIVRPGTDRQPLSLLDVEDFERESRTLEALVPFFQWSVNVTGRGEAERLQGLRVSPAYFEVTGARVQLGRPIQPADEHERVVLLTHGLWQRRFGGTAGVVGQPLVLNGDAFTIAGVLTPDFVSPLRDLDLVAPFSASADPRRANRSQGFLRVIARTKRGVTLDQVRDDLDRVSRSLRASYPDAHGADTGVLVRPLHEEVSGRAAPMLRMLLAAVGVVLLVACANLANLFLVRSTARRRELALRMALGATRRRIVAELVLEAVLLAVIGGALGVLVALGLVRGLLVMSPENLPRVAEVGIDWTVALFTLGVSFGASLLFGLAPAIQASRGDPRDALQTGDRAVSGGGAGLRATLVFAEVALSTLLLATAALLARSFAQVMAVDPGFRPSQVLTIRVSLPRTRYESRTAIENFYREVHPRLAALPGVHAVAAANVVPMNNYLATAGFFVDGVVVKDAPDAHYRMISPDYFRALGIGLRAGRSFTPADRADSLPVAIVNETFARQFWPGASPIGARMRLADGEKSPRVVEVIGVVGDVKHFGLEREAMLEVYIPIPQVPEATTIWLANNMYWVVQTAGPPLAAANSVRREIAAVDPGVPASFVRSMDQWVGASFAPRRFNLELVAVFAFAALLLAVLGVYSVSASTAALRTREIGIRTALGASKRQVVGLVLRSGLTPVLLGLIAGTVGVLASGPAMAGFLFGVAPHDPASLSIVALTLTTTALAASYVPARRASRADPLVALRAE